MVVAGRASKMLLNRSQELAVWRGVLEADKELESLRSVESLAEMAAGAWRFLCSYNGQGRLRELAVSTDTRAFQRWAQVFERRCRVDGLLTQAGLEEALRESLAAGEPEVGEIVLVGFDALTPAQMGLVEALRAAGSSVEELPVAVEGGERVLVEGADEREELRACARWVRQFLELRSDGRVGVIVPGLEGQRAQIDRIFREVLAPELERIEAGSGREPYEFSVGVALAETPMVLVAVELLRWAVKVLPTERVSGLLLSPYFAMAEGERSARAEFDAFELRRARMLRPEISLEWMVGALERSRRRTRLDRLTTRLRAMRAVAAGRLEGDEQRSYAEWAARMRDLLETAGWGVERVSGRGEDTLEFQTRQKWESALDELATLDFDGARVQFGEALDEVERIARRTVFAPESREAPVQVMGPLEAAGSQFDAVWFLRAGDLSWPMAVGSSSLLPWSLQRELGMPGVNQERDRAYSWRVTERIATSAGTVIFGYAKETTEGRQQSSSVLTNLGLERVEVTELAGVDAERSAIALEELDDAARVRPVPDRVIRGGARILELQAACGFRAFAEQRLWASELEAVELGMDARKRGTVVHLVLERFWDAVKTQSTLLAMTPEERNEVLDYCIAEALKKTAESSTTSWDAAYVEVQRDRLKRLLEPWLELEMERPDFSVKLSEKEFKDQHVGPLRLDVRVDRVDVTAAGELILDYKTGAAAPKDWLTERPDAPQLPLYAVLAETDKLKGVAFALVRAGEQGGIKGYASEQGVLTKPARTALSLEAQVEEWRRVLVQLATEFHEGDARVRPKRYPMTCERCGQRMLCRLDISLLEDDEEDQDGAGEVNGG